MSWKYDSGLPAGLNANTPSTPTHAMAAPMHTASRYQTIAAWRGVACLSVLLFHSFGGFTSEPIWMPLEPVRQLAGNGWLGLHLFFVISGYCIFERIGVAVVRGEAAYSFWIDRSLRIFPTYWAALAFTIALNLVTWPFNRTHLAANLPSSFLSFLGDVSLTSALFRHPAFVLVSWTLTCEVAFYLLAGLLLASGGNSRHMTRAFLVGSGLCGLAIAVPATGWTLPLALWPEFFAGACVSFSLRAPMARSRNFAPLGLVVLLALSAAAICSFGSYAGDSRKIALAFAWALLALYRWDAWLDRRLAVRLLSRVGVFSFSLYLTHVQIMTRVINLGMRTTQPTSPAVVLVWIAAVVTALAFGWLFWTLVESSSERLRGRWRARYSRKVGGPLGASAN
jgi:exopolysaccharide production protein ExoZ